MISFRGLPEGAGKQDPLCQPIGPQGFSNLLEAIVAKAVIRMKKRYLKLLKTAGEVFERKKLRLCSESDQIR